MCELKSQHAEWHFSANGYLAIFPLRFGSEGKHNCCSYYSDIDDIIL